MTLSIIIVNYNVKYFLEQCLCSVVKAIAGIESEVFVVDNKSADNSVDYLSPKFPSVHFVRNTENIGFGRANNLALRLATGDYILFLNPDTIVGEDSMQRCISFLDQQAQAGAVGVKMIDGTGNFLRESRRGLPTPWVSFCKLSGLTSLFPGSKWFARYYLGHQDDKVNNQVEILPGAFMMIRKETLNKTGGFDERFFMYAEDIDLSYRILLAGYFNYSLADTGIIHFKGESTRRDLRYVKYFYKAMSQFMHKYFSGGPSVIFVILMDAIIWVLAGLRSLAGFFSTGKERSPGETVRYTLEGEPGDSAELTVVLAQHDRIPATGKEKPDEIIFCEGKNLSFSRIIAAIQQYAPVRYLIHAEGSRGIVGSHSKKSMGEVIPMAK